MKKLIEKAKQVREMAYAPYSNFKVGAAIETDTGKVYTGCNVENASYAATCCAERTALANAIAEGERKFRRIAIVADTEGPCPPCGICRQVLYEFAPDIEVIMANTRDETLVQTLDELMPHAFHSKKLRSR